MNNINDSSTTSTKLLYNHFIIPFSIFWILYFIIGIILTNLRNVEFYNKFQISNRNVTEVKNKILRVNILNIIISLIKNVIASFVGTLIFHTIFGFYDDSQAQEQIKFGNMTTSLKISCLFFYILYRLPPQNENEKCKDLKEDYKIIILINHMMRNIGKICTNINDIVVIFIIIIIHNNNTSRETKILDYLIEYPLKLLISMYISDMIFYHGHYLVHQYEHLMKIHSQHHRIHHPIAISALMCSPLEMIFLNLPTVLVGPRFVNMTSNTFIVWTILSCVSTMISHDGHDLYFLNASFHDHHHSHYPYENFGLNPFWDQLYNTNQKG